MLVGINRIKIKSDNQEIRVDLSIDLDSDLTDDLHTKLVTSIIAIKLGEIKRQDSDLFSFEEDLAVHIATLLLETFEANDLVAEMFKIELNEESEFYHEEGSSFLQKREGDRMAYIPLNLNEWDLSD